MQEQENQKTFIITKIIMSIQMMLTDIIPNAHRNKDVHLKE